MLTVIYDENCYFCRQLAYLSQRLQSELSFVAQSEFKQQTPELAGTIQQEELAVFDSDSRTLLVGPAAWQTLVGRCPGLQQLNWLASRIGASNAIVVSVRRSAEFLRSFCKNCG